MSTEERIAKLRAASSKLSRSISPHSKRSFELLNTIGDELSQYAAVAETSSSSSSSAASNSAASNSAAASSSGSSSTLAAPAARRGRLVDRLGISVSSQPAPQTTQPQTVLKDRLGDVLMDPDDDPPTLGSKKDRQKVDSETLSLLQARLNQPSIPIPIPISSAQPQKFEITTVPIPRIKSSYPPAAKRVPSPAQSAPDIRGRSPFLNLGKAPKIGLSSATAYNTPYTAPSSSAGSANYRPSRSPTRRANPVPHRQHHHQQQQQYRTPVGYAAPLPPSKRASWVSNTYGNNVHPSLKLGYTHSHDVDASDDQPCLEVNGRRFSFDIGGLKKWQKYVEEQRRLGLDVAPGLMQRSSSRSRSSGERKERNASASHGDGRPTDEWNGNQYVERQDDRSKASKVPFSEASLLDSDMYGSPASRASPSPSPTREQRGDQNERQGNEGTDSLAALAEKSPVGLLGIDDLIHDGRVWDKSASPSARRLYSQDRAQRPHYALDRNERSREYNQRSRGGKEQHREQYRADAAAVRSISDKIRAKQLMAWSKSHAKQVVTSSAPKKASHGTFGPRRSDTPTSTRGISHGQSRDMQRGRSADGRGQRSSSNNSRPRGRDSSVGNSKDFRPARAASADARSRSATSGFARFAKTDEFRGRRRDGSPFFLPQSFVSSASDDAEKDRMTRWLDSIGMSKFTPLFLSKNVAKLSVVELLQLEDLMRMGVPLQEANTIISKIRFLISTTQAMSEVAVEGTVSEGNREVLSVAGEEARRQRTASGGVFSTTSSASVSPTAFASMPIEPSAAFMEPSFSVPVATSAAGELRARLISAFDSGDAESFTSAWQAALGLQARSTLTGEAESSIASDSYVSPKNPSAAALFAARLDLEFLSLVHLAVCPHVLSVVKGSANRVGAIDTAPLLKFMTRLTQSPEHIISSLPLTTSAHFTQLTSIVLAPQASTSVAFRQLFTHQWCCALKGKLCALLGAMGLPSPAGLDPALGGNFPLGPVAMPNQSLSSQQEPEIPAQLLMRGRTREPLYVDTSTPSSTSSINSLQQESGTNRNSNATSRTREPLFPSAATKREPLFPASETAPLQLKPGVPLFPINTEPISVTAAATAPVDAAPVDVDAAATAPAATATQAISRDTSKARTTPDARLMMASLLKSSRGAGNNLFDGGTPIAVQNSPRGTSDIRGASLGQSAEEAVGREEPQPLHHYLYPSSEPYPERSPRDNKDNSISEDSVFNGFDWTNDDLKLTASQAPHPSSQGFANVSRLGQSRDKARDSMAETAMKRSSEQLLSVLEWARDTIPSSPPNSPVRVRNVQFAQNEGADESPGIPLPVYEAIQARRASISSNASTGGTRSRKGMKLTVVKPGSRSRSAPPKAAPLVVSPASQKNPYPNPSSKGSVLTLLKEKPQQQEKEGAQKDAVSDKNASPAATRARMARSASPKTTSYKFTYRMPPSPASSQSSPLSGPGQKGKIDNETTTTPAKRIESGQGQGSEVSLTLPRRFGTSASSGTSSSDASPSPSSSSGRRKSSKAFYTTPVAFGSNIGSPSAGMVCSDLAALSSPSIGEGGSGDNTLLTTIRPPLSSPKVRLQSPAAQQFHARMEAARLKSIEEAREREEEEKRKERARIREEARRAKELEAERTAYFEMWPAWDKYRDDEGAVYYYNSSTGESRWQPPTWEVHRDEEGRVYFYNSASKESSWDAPVEGIVGRVNEASFERRTSISENNSSTPTKQTQSNGTRGSVSSGEKAKKRDSTTPDSLSRRASNNTIPAKSLSSLASFGFSSLPRGSISNAPETSPSGQMLSNSTTTSTNSSSVDPRDSLTTQTSIDVSALQRNVATGLVTGTWAPLCNFLLPFKGHEILHTLNVYLPSSAISPASLSSTSSSFSASTLSAADRSTATTLVLLAARFGILSLLHMLRDSDVALDTQGVIVVPVGAQDRFNEAAGASGELAAIAMSFGMGGVDTTGRPIRCSAAHLASRLGSLEVLRFLVQCGVDCISCLDSEGNTPLMLACAWGRAECVSYLCRLPGLEVNWSNARGFSAACAAAARGDVRLLQVLMSTPGSLQPMPSPHAPTTSPLLETCRYGRSEALQFLLGAGAEMDSRDSLGDTALSLCIKCGHSDLLEDLLANGADPRALQLVPLSPARGSYANSATNLDKSSLSSSQELGSVSLSLEESMAAAAAAAFTSPAPVLGTWGTVKELAESAGNAECRRVLSAGLASAETNDAIISPGDLDDIIGGVKSQSSSSGADQTKDIERERAAQKILQQVERSQMRIRQLEEEHERQQQLLKQEQDEKLMKAEEAKKLAEAAAKESAHAADLELQLHNDHLLAAEAARIAEEASRSARLAEEAFRLASKSESEKALKLAALQSEYEQEKQAHTQEKMYLMQQAREREEAARSAEERAEQRVQEAQLEAKKIQKEKQEQAAVLAKEAENRAVEAARLAELQAEARLTARLQQLEAERSRELALVRQEAVEAAREVELAREKIRQLEEASKEASKAADARTSAEETRVALKAGNENQKKDELAERVKLLEAQRLQEMEKEKEKERELKETAARQVAEAQARILQLEEEKQRQQQQERAEKQQKAEEAQRLVEVAARESARAAQLEEQQQLLELQKRELEERLQAAEASRKSFEKAEKAANEALQAKQQEGTSKDEDMHSALQLIKKSRPGDARPPSSPAPAPAPAPAPVLPSSSDLNAVTHPVSARSASGGNIDAQIAGALSPRTAQSSNTQTQILTPPNRMAATPARPPPRLTHTSPPNLHTPTSPPIQGQQLSQAQGAMMAYSTPGPTPHPPISPNSTVNGTGTGTATAAGKKPPLPSFATVPTRSVGVPISRPRTTSSASPSGSTSPRSSPASPVGLVGLAGMVSPNGNGGFNGNFSSTRTSTGPRPPPRPDPQAALRASRLAGAVPLPGFDVANLSLNKARVGGNARPAPQGPAPPRPPLFPPNRTRGTHEASEDAELFWDGSYGNERQYGAEEEESDESRRTRALREALLNAPEFQAVYVPYNDPSARTDSSNSNSNSKGPWTGPLFES